MVGPETSGAPEPHAPPSSVAQEAALLVDLLMQHGPFGMPPGRATDGAAGPSAAGPANTTAGTQPTDARQECTCGGTTPQACRTCPVCQLIAVVQKVNPATIERVADFAAFAAAALRDVAEARREQSRRATGEQPAESDVRVAAPGTAE